MTIVLQSTSPPSAEAAVACAIYCCDKAEHSLTNTRGGRKTCQRLGHRKHSCVLRKLRESDRSGRLTTTNKVPGVQASPRIKVKGIKRTLIPDTIVDGNKVIDAKFPCKTEDVHGPNDNPAGTGPGFTKGSARRAYPSVARTGAQMSTPKEAIDYKKIPGVQKVECMTPEDAKRKKGEDCSC
jgi:hypothetical protein